jgi:hypothetical protein
VKIFVPSVVAVSLAATCVACGSDVSDPIVAPMPTVPTTQPSPVTDFPVLTHSGTIYGEQDDLYAIYWPNQGRLTSRYVIYDDGTFELQFVSAVRGFFTYAGTYSRSGADVVLDFSDSDTAGAWNGMATLSGDQMSVKYSVIMMMADFVDGIYKKGS